MWIYIHCLQPAIPLPTVMVIRRTCRADPLELTSLRMNSKGSLIIKHHSRLLVFVDQEKIMLAIYDSRDPGICRPYKKRM